MHHIHIDDLARDAKAGKADIIERAHAAERWVPPRAVEARISGRCAVSRRREPLKVGRQVLAT